MYTYRVIKEKTNNTFRVTPDQSEKKSKHFFIGKKN